MWDMTKPAVGNKRKMTKWGSNRSKVPGVHPRTERWLSTDSPSHESHPMHLLCRKAFRKAELRSLRIHFAFTLRWFAGLISIGTTWHFRVQIGYVWRIETLNHFSPIARLATPVNVDDSFEQFATPFATLLLRKRETFDDHRSRFGVAYYRSTVWNLRSAKCGAPLVGLFMD